MDSIPPPPEATVPPPPQPARAPAVDAFLRGWGTALIRGLLAFAVMTVLGEIAAFTVYFVGNGDAPIATVAKVGWFYFAWFHHIDLTVSVANLSFPGGSQIGGFPSGGSVSLAFGIALMLGTFLAVWLLYLGGKAVADRADGGGLARVLHGLKIAPVYAGAALLVSLVVKISETVTNSSVSGTLEIKPSALQAFLIPLLLAAGAGVVGGLRSGRYELLSLDPWGRRGAGALSGGLRMFVLALVLAFAGLLVLAVVEPDSTRSYFATVSKPPVDETAVIIAHHVLVLPNQSMWVLIPAMGGCDGAEASHFSTTFLCYWRYPKQVSIGPFTPEGILGLAPPVRTEFGTAPVGYFLFLLVPALAVLLGGRHAVRKRAQFRSETMGIGALAGVVFAFLVLIGAWFASVTGSADLSVAGFSLNSSVHVGPDVLTGGLLALAWGVIGGGLGGWLSGRDLPAHAPMRETQGAAPTPPPYWAGAPEEPATQADATTESWSQPAPQAEHEPPAPQAEPEPPAEPHSSAEPELSAEPVSPAEPEAPTEPEPPEEGAPGPD